MLLRYLVQIKQKLALARRHVRFNTSISNITLCGIMVMVSDISVTPVHSTYM